MKQKRDAGIATLRGAGASGSSSSGRLRKTASKEGGKAHSAKTARKSKSSSLTAVRVAHVISQLDNKRGSTMESIRSKLIRSGQKTNTSLIRNALERAVKSGLLREIREERFSLPSNRSGSNSNSSRSNSRTSAKTARRVSSKGHQRKLAVSPRSKRRQRRPPRGRRPANSENEGAVENDDEARDGHDDDDTGLGDGDVEAESSGNMVKNTTSSRVSVAEPVAGCDAVMVFGTH